MTNSAKSPRPESLLHTPIGTIALGLTVSLLSSVFTVGITSLGQFAREIPIRLAVVLAIVVVGLWLLASQAFRRWTSFVAATVALGFTVLSVAFTALSVYTTWFAALHRTPTWVPVVWSMNSFAFAFFTFRAEKLRMRIRDDDVGEATATLARSLLSGPTGEATITDQLAVLADQQRVLTTQVQSLINSQPSGQWRGPKNVGRVLTAIGWLQHRQ